MLNIQEYTDHRAAYDRLENQYLFFNAKDIVVKSLKLIRPRAHVPIIKWLEDNLVLPDTFPIPGPFRIKNSPHLKEPLEKATDPEVRSITLMGCSQFGKTLFFICLWAYDVVNDPCSWLYAHPTDGGVKSFALQKLEPVINATPILRKTIAKQRRGMSEDSTRRYKLYPGGWMEIINLQSPGKTRQRSVKKIINDDTDELKITSKSEGSAHINLEGRTDAFKFDYKFFHGSTPRLVDSSFIELKFNEGSRANYYVKCKNCKKEMVLNEDKIVWDKEQLDLVGHDFVHKYETAKIKCEHCDYEIDERERSEILALGKAYWKHKRKDQVVDLSYQLGKASSTLTSLAKIAKKRNEAEKAAENGDDSLYESYVNNEKGLPYKKIVATEIDAKVLLDRREDYIDPENKRIIPNDIYLLTAWTDAQAGSQLKPPRFECEVWGWGYGEECWIVDKIIIEGSPEDRKTHKKVKDWFFPDGEPRIYKRKDGYELKIKRAGFDAGWASQSIYELCELMSSKGWYATMGQARYNAPLLPRKFSLMNKKKTLMMMLGSQVAKAVLYERLTTIVEPGPKRIHHTKYYCDLDYFDQLTADRARLVTAGLMQRYIYEKKKPQLSNEASDIWCGNYAMMKSLNVNWKALKKNIDAKVGSLSNDSKDDDLSDKVVKVKVDETKNTVKGKRQEGRGKRRSGKRSNNPITNF